MKVLTDDIIAVIREVGVSADVSRIRADTRLSEAGIDSLDMMNVLLGIEQKFGVKIPDERINALRTVDDIASCLQSL
jgi:acyl carrier protein